MGFVGAETEFLNLLYVVAKLMNEFKKLKVILNHTPCNPLPHFSLFIYIYNIHIAGFIDVYIYIYKIINITFLQQTKCQKTTRTTSQQNHESTYLGKNLYRSLARMFHCYTQKTLLATLTETCWGFNKLNIGKFRLADSALNQTQNTGNEYSDDSISMFCAWRIIPGLVSG